MTDYVLGDRGTVHIITDDYYDTEILHIFEELQIDRERIWNGEARLVPEPDNPHQAHAIAVYVDDLKVGRLTEEDSAIYWNPVGRVVVSGYEPMAQLQLRAVLRRVDGETYIESSGSLSLSAPGSLFPLNQAPTQATLLPQGPSMKVLDEKDYSEYLHSILPPSGEGRLILSLENNQIKHPDGRVTDSVEVLHDRKMVGRLSTQISEQLAPIIRYAYDHGKLTSAWGTIRGNSFELSLTVQAARPSDIADEWFETLPNNVPELVPVADTYDIPDAYYPTEGELQQPTTSKKKRSIMVSRGGDSLVQEAAISEARAEQVDGSLGVQRLAVLLGIFGGSILILGIIAVFFKPLLGVLGIVLGASVAFLALYFGRENSYDEQEVSADLLEH